MPTVYFATNRRPDDRDNPTKFTEEFAGDPEDLRFGTADVPGEELYKADTDSKLDRIGDRAVIAVEPESLHQSDIARSTLGSTAIFHRIRDEMAAGKDAILVVHGYDYTFRQSIARAAQIAQWYDRPDRLVLQFSWPSLGRGVSPTTYRNEQRRARASGPALGRAILKAAEFVRGLRQEDRCNGRIHLVAHSMGNHVLQYAVRTMKEHVGDNIPPLFDQVVLLAADDDSDSVSRPDKMAPLINGCNRVSVYHNVQDLALLASRHVIGNPSRLGRGGPDYPAALPSKVTVLNAAPAIIWSEETGREEWEEPPPWDDYEDWQRDPTGHQYYRNNPTIRDDIRQVLAGRADGDIEGRTATDVGYRIDDPFYR